MLVQFFWEGKWLSSVRHDAVLGVAEGGREGADGDAHFAGNVEWCAGGSEGIEESFQGAQADAAKFHGKLWGGGAFVPRTKDAQARVVNSAELGGHGRRRVDRKTQGGESKRRRKGIVNNHGRWARGEEARNGAADAHGCRGHKRGSLAGKDGGSVKVGHGLVKVVDGGAVGNAEEGEGIAAALEERSEKGAAMRARAIVLKVAEGVVEVGGAEGHGKT